MRLAAPLLGLILVAPIVSTSAAGPPELVASTSERTPADERKAFHLPEGFVAELVASEPEIHKPLNLAFDDKGRLWVTETLEYPFPAPEGRTPRDGVKILSDFGPDGHARKITTFAEGLNIPIGLLPLPSSNEALVHSIPHVLKLTDTDGDGKADRREPLYKTYGFRDTHGMTNAFTWGFDGWVYACHGFSNESKVEGADRKAIVMQSGNTYRMRPDGSHAEYVTHGQVNPFGLAFDPLGNLYSCDCHSRPIYQLLRGAWYPSFGKPHDGLGFGPEMTFHDHGSTGIAGIVYYAADQFPAAFRDTVFIGNVVTSRINHDSIDWQGSTPKAIEKPDFLVSDDPWFRPVDIELGPDGALYVADFYNKIIGHYEVPLTHPGRDRERGRIWRIVYRGKDGNNPLVTPRNDWTTASTPSLIEDLGHPNLTVRMKAANQLAVRVEPRPVEEFDRIVRADKSPLRRVHALWVLERWGKLTDETLAEAAGDSDPTVRVHAQRVIAEFPSLDNRLSGLATKALGDADPHVRRAAAEALGRHPASTNIKPLLALIEETPAVDTHLIHVARMALRDQLLENDAWARLAKERLNDREVAGIADVATGVPTASAAGFLLDHLKRPGLKQEMLVSELHHIARHLEPDRMGELADYLLEGPNIGALGTAGRLKLVALMKAVQQGTQERGAKLFPGIEGLSRQLAEALLDSATDAELAAGIEISGSFKMIDARGRLAKLSRNEHLSQSRRMEAMAALMTIDPGAGVDVVGQMLGDPSVSIPLREKAAALVAQSGQPTALPGMLNVLPTAPDRVQTAIAAGLAARREGAEALLDLVASGKASARLLQEPRVSGPLGNAGVANLSQRLAPLLRGLPPADQRVNSLIARRRAGFASGSHDANAGARVYETHCVSCHQIGGKGSKVGPQLDGIGGRGPDRLMEDVLDPSRNVDQAFRVTNLALKDGRVVSGLLLREEGAVLVMADAQGKEVRIPSDTVEERSVAPLSPMPANFADQVPEADFYRLIDFLVARRAEGTPSGGK